MLSTKILAATAAAMIAIGTMGIGATDASAATMTPHHHMLVCKAGSVAHLVKIKGHDGKWHRVWKCYRIHHKHYVHHMAPKAKAKTY
jgi:hypothetical protein